MEIVVKTIFGSHLYGTNLPGSDIDYKVIYKDSLEDIILKKQNDVKRTVLDDHSEETEYIELRKFIKDLADGQTYAVDMLFTPDFQVLQRSDIWETIKKNKRNLLSKDCKAFIGYCMNQAKLYSEKGERIRKIQEVQEEVSKLPQDGTVGDKLKTMQIVKRECKRNNKFVLDDFYELHGKYYAVGMRVKELTERLQNAHDKYGVRSKKVSQVVKDWKSIYHAYRTVRELRELASKGFIRFPLACADELIEIRKGEWPQYKDKRLQWELDSAVADVRASSCLIDSVDKEWLDNFILSFYL